MCGVVRPTVLLCRVYVCVAKSIAKKSHIFKFIKYLCEMGLVSLSKIFVYIENVSCADETKTLCEVFGKRGMVWPHILILCGTAHNTRSQTQYLGVVYQASFGYINVTLYKLNFGSILSTLTKRLIDNIYGSLMFIGFTPHVYINPSSFWTLYKYTAYAGSVVLYIHIFGYKAKNDTEVEC